MTHLYSNEYCVNYSTPNPTQTSTPIPTPTPTPCITQLGQNINGKNTNEKIGSSISLNGTGDRIAIGAPGLNSNGIPGTARIYGYDGISWTQIGQDINGDFLLEEIENMGYSVGLNYIGDMVAIGSPNNEYNGDFAGSIKVYSYNGISWVQVGQSFYGEPGDHLGRSISLIGPRPDPDPNLNINLNRIAFGAFQKIKIYEYNGISWIQIGQDINGDFNIGYSISLNAYGNIVATGSPSSDGFVGKTTIYSYNGTSWTQLGQDISQNVGQSVSLNGVGNIVAIGGANTYSGKGSVGVYSYDGSSWNQLGQDIIGEFKNGTGFSVSLNFAGDVLAVGSPRPDVFPGPNHGFVKIYHYDGNSWNQIGITIDDTTNYDNGYSVSLNSIGNVVALGNTNYFYEGLEYCGKTRIFSIDCTTSNH